MHKTCFQKLRLMLQNTTILVCTFVAAMTLFVVHAGNEFRNSYREN